MSKIKILIIIDQMATGGAGRVTSTLIPGLLENNYDVTIALDNVNCKNFYLIPEEVQQVFIPIKGRITSGFKQISLIINTYKIIKAIKPDVIIAVTFFPFFYAHYGSIGTGIPIICYDHTSFGRNMGRFINWIRFDLYGKADKLIILTEKDKRLLGDKFPNKEVVYNPLTYPLNFNKCRRNKTVLCAGRMDSWDVKGFDRIIKIWSHLSPKYPEWKLQIAGGGSNVKMAEVKAMAETSGVAKKIEFLGQVYDMPSLYAVTSIFALPSRIEGFPMVLLEAMSQGCVCCTFAMDGAVREMMSSTSGIIVNDGDLRSFESELERLIRQYPEYDTLRESGYKDAERFNCKSFYKQWDLLIKSVLK